MPYSYIIIYTNIQSWIIIDNYILLSFGFGPNAVGNTN